MKPGLLGWGRLAKNSLLGDDTKLKYPKAMIHQDDKLRSRTASVCSVGILSSFTTSVTLERTLGPLGREKAYRAPKPAPPSSPPRTTCPTPPMVRTTSGLSRHDNRFRKFSRQRFHRIEPLLGPNPNPHPNPASEPPGPPNTAGAGHDHPNSHAG